MKDKEGLFITIEGPNGSGKSAILKMVAKELLNEYEVKITKEPTESKLGDFTRKAEEFLSKEALACLVGADRYYHLEEIVTPSLIEFDVVLSDRYVESSLVLQHLDNIPLNYIWEINRKVRIPDLSVILVAEPEILHKRLSQREKYSRFEKTKKRETELAYYFKAASFIKKKGFKVFLQYNGKEALKRETCKKIVREILEIGGLK